MTELRAHTKLLVFVLAILVLGVAGGVYGNARLTPYPPGEPDIPPKPPFPPHPSYRTFSTQSYVDNVQTIGFVIIADDRLTITLRYTGETSSPAVTLIVFASGEYYYIVRGYAETTVPPRENASYPQQPPFTQLVGSTILQAGWSSPSTVSLRLVGVGSMFDATNINIQILPFTG